MSNDIDYMISVMQAAKRGEEIECRMRISTLNPIPGPWQSIGDPNPGWNWGYLEYRVKPKEPRVFWMTFDQAGKLYGLYNSKEEAKKWELYGECSKFVEVLE